MNKKELKDLIKEAVTEAFNDKLNDILLEAIKNNKPNISETITNSNKINPHIKKSYSDIINEMKEGPKSPLDGEMKISHNIDTISEGSSLPTGQVSLNQISNLLKPKN